MPPGIDLTMPGGDQILATCHWENLKKFNILCWCDVTNETEVVNVTLLFGILSEVF